MEPPTKRQRIENLGVGRVTYDTELDQAPSFTDLRLKFKSRLEAIFDKYDRDFSGVGDEVDIQTGEVVVNNGHLAQLPDEDDVLELASDDEWASESSDDDILGPYEVSLWTTPRKMQPIGPTTRSGYEPPSKPKQLPMNGGQHRSISPRFFNVSDSFATDNDLQQRQRVVSAGNHDNTNIADPKWQFPQVPEELFTSKKFIPRLASEGPLGVNEKLGSHQTSRKSALQRVSNRKRSRESPRGSEIFWTDDEIQKLKHLRLVAHKSFPAILPHFPKRSLGSIVGFWGRLKQKENLVDTTGQTKQLVSDVFWTEEEVEKLKHLRLQTKSSWPVIAQHFPKRSVRSLIAYWSRLNHNETTSPLGRGNTKVTVENETTTLYLSPVADRKNEEKELVASRDLTCNEASTSCLGEHNAGQAVSAFERIPPSPLSKEKICPPRDSDHSRSHTLQHLIEPLPNKEDRLPLPYHFQGTQPSVVPGCATQLPSPSNSKTTETPPVSIHELTETVSARFFENMDVRRRPSYGFADELMKELVEAANGDTNSGENLLPREAYHESLEEMADPESGLPGDLGPELHGSPESNLSGDHASELPGGLELELAKGHETTQVPSLDGAEPNNLPSTPSIVYESSPPTEALGFRTLPQSELECREEILSDDGVLITSCGPSTSLIDTPHEKLTPSPERSAVPVLPSVSHSKPGSGQLPQVSSTPGSLLGAISAIAGSKSGRGHESKSVGTVQEKNSTAPCSTSRVHRSLATPSNPPTVSKRRTEQKARKRRSKSRLSRVLKEIPSTSQPSSISLSSLFSDNSEDELSSTPPQLFPSRLLQAGQPRKN